MLVGSTTSTTTAPTVASGSDQSSKVEVQPMETSKGKTIRVIRNGESPNAKKNFHHHAAVASEKTTDSLEHQQLLENRHQENILQSVQQSEKSKLEDKDKKQTSTQSQTQNEEEVDLLRNCDGGIRYVNTVFKNYQKLSHLNNFQILRKRDVLQVIFNHYDFNL